MRTPREEEPPSPHTRLVTVGECAADREGCDAWEQALEASQVSSVVVAHLLGRPALPCACLYTHIARSQPLLAVFDIRMSLPTPPRATSTGDLQVGGAQRRWEALSNRLSLVSNPH